MNVLHVDLETTGLDSGTHQIIEIGMVYDTFDQPIDELATFHSYVKHDPFMIDPFCLKMHAEMWPLILKKGVYCELVGLQLGNWLRAVGEDIEKGKYHFNLCGKNIGPFDLQFLKSSGLIGQLEKHEIRFRHRVLDIGALVVRKEDSVVPDLKGCLERTGLVGEVTHTALEDAMLCCRMLRKIWNVNEKEV